MVKKNKLRRKTLTAEKSVKTALKGKNNFSVPEGIRRIKIKVIGIGDGAGNIVSEIAPRLKKASFLAVNTDQKPLKKISGGAETFQFGQNTTFGLGTGMNPELAENAAKESQERIKKILKCSDLCVFIATLGGGTGSGAAPIFAEISKNLGNLNYGIFTLPFAFEGRKRMEIAKNSIEKLKQNLNVFSIIENERIFKIIDRKLPLKTALSQINKILADGLEGLIEIIYEPGIINIDFADIKTIFKGEGNLAYLNSIETAGENRVKEVIEKILNSQIYSYNIRGARGILYDIAGDKNLGLADVGEISKSIFELAERGAKIIFGVSEKKEYNNKIKVSLLASGCKSNFFPETKLPPSLKRRRAKQKKKAKRIKIIEETQKEDSGAENLPQVRKNALQLKKEAEEAEKELMEKEKFWETPAFLRHKNQNPNAEND